MSEGLSDTLGLWNLVCARWPMSNVLRALQSDITQLQVEAIVNAANSSLLGGGGADGAINRAAGPELVHECRLLGGGGCKTGEVKITKGHRLWAKYLIHTVGPVWRGGTSGEPELLACCYRRSIELAASKGVSCLAFPRISTGIYSYPIALAAKVAVRSVRETIAQGSPYACELALQSPLIPTLNHARYCQSKQP
jgi:O-acetyl-ADP-ribose deacetylase